MNKESNQGMSVIVKTVSNMTVWFVLLFGIYIISHGHVSPGSGFVGGMIVALALVQLMLAYGKTVALRKVPEAVTSFFESMGAILLLGIALLGFTSGYFFLNFIGKGEPFRLFSAGIIPLANLAISLKVGAGIFGIFVAFILLRVERGQRKNKSRSAGE